MGYYITMESVTFESGLTPEEMRNKIVELGAPFIGYEDDNADFSINCDVSPMNKYVYDIVPYQGDYYFKYDEEKMEAVTNFISTIIAPGRHMLFQFYGDTAWDLWGSVVTRDQVLPVGYELTVKTPECVVGYDEFVKSLQTPVAFQKAVVKGKECLFCDNRDATSPPGYDFKYDIRHDDEQWEPCSIEKWVFVNYYGSIYTEEEVFPELNCKDNLVELDEEDFGFVD
ncbi:MAG: hypothetical protein NT178_02015 [Proteobacteria bacterium]|nr:hypothetical protein [Pseudomonadota bacterium]